MNVKFIVFALVTLAVVAFAWKITEDKAPQTDVSRTLLYPGLADRVNDVAQVRVRSADQETVLERNGDTWVVTNRDGFPATFSNIKRTLLQLASLEIVEAKTTRAEQYGRIGVSDPDQEGADGTLVELRDASGDVIAALIDGHERSGGGATQRYARRMGEAQSWLVAGELEAPADPIPWLDAQIADIGADRVQRVTIRPRDGDAVVVTKDEPSENYFELQNIPAGFKAKSRTTVSSLGAVLINLRFNDVASAERVANQQPESTVVLETFDGLRARISLFEVEDRTLARFAFEYDVGLVHVAEEGTDSDADEPQEAEGEASEDAAVTETPEQLATRLAGLTEPWVYELPDYKMRMINKRFQDLIEEEPAEDPAPATTE